MKRQRSIVTIGLFLFLVAALVVQPLKIESDEDVTTYLKMYGYLPENYSLKEVITTRPKTTRNKMLLDGIIMFQRFSGITETGRLDKETMDSMNKQRCGMPERMDIMENKMMRRENVTHAIPSMIRARRWRRWKSPRVLYKITSFPKVNQSGTTLDEDAVKKEIRRAFKLWEKEANLSCIEVDSNDESRWARAHIDISFVIGDHGDGSAFGRMAVGNVAAHAFFPDHHRFRGNIHFDDERIWTAFTLHGVNLFQTAAHEIGHALGLDHSRFPESVMHMYLKPQLQENFTLHEDDIMGIRNLYGRKEFDQNDYHQRSDFPGVKRKKFRWPQIKSNSQIRKVTVKEKSKVAGPILVFSARNSQRDGDSMSRSPNKVLNRFWKCFPLLYTPSQAREVTKCYTSLVSKLLNRVLK